MSKEQQAAGQPAQQPTEAEEFDRLMALDTDHNGEPVESAGQTQPPAQAAGGDGKDTGGQSAPGDGGAGGGTSTEQPGATGTTSGTTEEDWLATSDLPDEVKDRIRADRTAREQAATELQQRYDALHGRLAPTQQALSDAQRRLAQLQQQPAQPAQPATPAAGASQQEVDSFFDSAGWKQYAEDYPGDAKVLRGMFDAQREASQKQLKQLDDRVNSLAQRLEQTAQVATRQVVNEEIAALDKRHPDWRELNGSDEFWDWFNTWRTQQPRTMRDQYYNEGRLNELFADSEWTASLLDSYKAEKAPATAATTTTQQTTPPAQTEGTAPAQTQQPAGNGKLAMSVQPQVRGGAPHGTAVNIDGMTEAQAFDALWKLPD